MRCPSGKPRLGTGSGVPCKRVGTVHLAPTHLRLVTHYGGLPKFHVLVGLCGRLPYSEPTHVERRNEDEGQKRCDRQSAHDRAGHRPPEDGRCGRDHAEDGRGSGEQDRSEPMRAEMPSVAQIAAVPGSWLSTSSSQRGCAVRFQKAASRAIAGLSTGSDARATMRGSENRAVNALMSCLACTGVGQSSRSTIAAAGGMI